MARGDLTHNAFGEKVLALEPQVHSMQTENILQQLFEHIDILERVKKLGSASTIPRRVCIIGGGISGLIAAFEIRNIHREFNITDSEIVILEKSNRLGGRVFTHYFGSEERELVEFGPMRIPSDHETVHYYLNKLGLSSHVFQHEQYYYYSKSARDTFPTASRGNSGLMSRKRFDEFMTEALPNLLSLRGLKLSDDIMNSSLLKSLDPAVLEEEFYRIIMNINESSVLFPRTAFTDAEGRSATQAPFENKPEGAASFGAQPDVGERILDLFRNRPQTDWGTQIESMSVRQGFLLALRQSNKMLQKNSHMSAALADLLWESFGRATGLIWLEHISLAHFLREQNALLSKQKRRIAGGFSKLVQSLESHLRNDDVKLRTSHRVKGVDVSEQGVTVVWTNRQGEQKSALFDAVICTTPAGSTTQIAFTPDLSALKRYALMSMNYLSAAKSGVLVNRKFFQRGSSEARVIRTDLPLQQLWIPRIEHNIESQDRYAFIASYMWSENAHRFSSLTSAERDDLVLRSLEEMYPGRSDQIEEVVHHCWDNQHSPGGGAFAYYNPGQQSRYQRDASEPHPRQTPKVFFAGEHLGLIQGWIQSAMQTAAYAVLCACGVPDPASKSSRR